MGVLLSHPTVYEEPLRIRYRANSIGARVCEVVGLLTVLIVPFIICLAMNNFWTQHNVVTERPRITFTERCLLKYTTRASGQEKLWACSDALNEELSGDPRFSVPFVSLASSDNDNDNRIDEFTFTFQLDLGVGGSALDDDGLILFEFLPEFDVSIWNYAVHLRMLTAPFIVLRDAALDGSRAVVVNGELRYQETDLIQANEYVRYDRVYTSSLFDTIQDVAAASNVGNLAALYAMQNQSIGFRPTAVQFGDASILPSPDSAVIDFSGANAVTVVLRLRVVDAEVSYRPGYGEILKWAWVQYFTVAYVIHWVVSWGRWLFVKQGLINTIAVWEGKSAH